MFKSFAWLAALLLCAVNTVAVAQTGKMPWEEYDKLIKSGEAVGTLGPTLFGDQVNFYNGALSFSVTDISLKGNNALPVAITRTFNVKNRKAEGVLDAPMADWDLDLPRLTGTYAPNWPDKRCTVATVGAARPPSVAVGSGPDAVIYQPEDYWHGIQAQMPGGGEMLLADRGTQQPTTGGPYYWMTSEFTYFSCLSSLQSGPGEGFLAITKDGTKYRFDRMASYAEPPLFDADKRQMLSRRVQALYATYVEDRFGNWVTYTYANGPTEPVRLTKIESSDGRRINLYYNTYGHVVKATVGTREWIYDYDYPTSTRGSLKTVVLPDDSSWSLNMRALSEIVIRYEPGQYCPPEAGPTCTEPLRSCGDPGLVVDDVVIGTVTHPSGATGEFTVRPKRHGRSNVPMVCANWQLPVNDPNNDVAYYPKAFDAPTLITKRVTGPGLKDAQWDYSYEATIGFAPGTGPVCTSGNCGAPVCLSDSCAGTAVTTVAGPDNEWVQYTFGNSYRYNEAKLLRTETGTGPTDIRRTNVTSYELAQSGMPYPTPIATSPQPRGDGFIAEYLRPQKTNTINQDGVDFSSIVNGFDRYARPESVTKFSSLPDNPTRTEATAYYDREDLWALGQVGSVTCVAPAECAGMTISQTEYDAATALPVKQFSFGQLLQTLTYNLAPGDQAGTVATVKDGNNKITTVSNWKRGIPQSIKYPATAESPSGAIESAVVNDYGTIDSVTDENGYKTCYLYDDMSRLTRITYPSESVAGVCDTTTWNTTLLGFSKVATTSEYGIPQGHWKQTISTGNGLKVKYFDAFWRPLVEESYDTANPTATRSIRVSRYNASGDVEFQSYPVDSLGTYADTALTGTTTTYDPLGRVKTVKQDSERGVLTTQTDYLTGFQTRVTNPKDYNDTTANYPVVTSYLAYDEPTTDWPVSIAQWQIFTEIERDVFGKSKALTRRNSTGSRASTRRYVYNNYQQLCKTIEPETQSTVMSYDWAGNLVWSASNQDLPTTTNCDLQFVAADKKVNRSYDGRNRLTSLTFADGRGNQNWTYTPDGLPSQITTYNGANQTLPVINAYQYNRRRMLNGQGESISQPGWYTWGIGYGYNANGHLASHAYPNNFTITYLPDALGRPTQVGTYATGVSYWPNGAIKRFTYGNLVVHELAQNDRGLPEISRDYYGTTDFLNDAYIYDPNGNIEMIDDSVSGRTTRNMTYDKVDRLETVKSPMYGAIQDETARYGYDELDNLTHVIAPGRDHYYCYDLNWQLTNIKTGSCNGTTVIGMGYEDKFGNPTGNVTNKNGQEFDFDHGNRLRQVATAGGSVIEAYRYDGHGRRVLAWNPTGNILSQYSQSGQLMFQYDQRRMKFFGYMYLGGSLVAIGEQQAPGGGPVTAKYQHTDALGSPVAVTDANRAPVGVRNEYEPFGRVLVALAPQDGPGYTGHVYDSATGQNYMQQRYYDPNVGRFLSSDPITADGNSGANFNRYWYANDNPYKFKDPDGRWGQPFQVPSFGGVPGPLPENQREALVWSKGAQRPLVDPKMQAQALDKVATRLSVLEVTSLGMLHPEMAGVFGAGSAFTSLAAFTYEPSWGRFANVAMFGAFNGLGALAKGADGVFASQANEAIEVADNSMNGASLIIEMNDQQNEFTRTLDDAVRVRDSEIEGQEKR